MDVQILSHRGFWLSQSEKNTPAAFERSFANGLGTETDLRDCRGDIVISHDMPRGTEMTLGDLLTLMDGRNLMLALNIKADGLGRAIKDILARFEHTNYFTFDMSIPDMVQHEKAGITFFTGLSDIQKSPVLLESARGVWLDCFLEDWYDRDLIEEYLRLKKCVCIVSADLHGRPVDNQWRIVRQVRDVPHGRLYLCTDYPVEAQRYFGNKSDD